MAEAPGHLLGQYIGGLLEAASEPELRVLTDRYGLQLDVKGARPGIREGKLLTLKDSNGNKHDLDFVVERAGDASGEPVYAAFVECAWRRYTKHSKAKAQEIQGAVLPLIETHRAVSPTPAAIVAGQWSRPSIKQLESSGFVVLVMDFATLASVFAEKNVDIRGQDDVSDKFWATQVDKMKRLTDDERQELIDSIRSTHREDYDSFIAELEARIIRTVEAVMFYPLHGAMITFGSLKDAIEGVRRYRDAPIPSTFLRYELAVRYTNGDSITGSYTSEQAAADFLTKLL